MEEARATDKNPRIVLQNLSLEIAGNPTVKSPRVYMACGLEDALIGVNRKFWKALEESGVDITYEETEGMHNWTFWNE